MATIESLTLRVEVEASQLPKLKEQIENAMSSVKSSTSTTNTVFDSMRNSVINAFKSISSGIGRVVDDVKGLLRWFTSLQGLLLSGLGIAGVTELLHKMIGAASEQETT